MKTKIIMLVVLMSCSAALIAQPDSKDSKKSFRGQNKEMRMNDHQRGPQNGLNLTDAQKDAFQKSRLEMQKQLQPLRNELGEVKAHQKTLMTADKPDISSINKNIEKLGSIRVEMAKIEAQHRLDMRAQLTDEQRLKFDMHKGRMMQQRGPEGMRQRRGMQEDRSRN
jgi:Spy/CpxP family protein refolding chaperone